MTPAGVCVPLLCIVCPSESMLDGRVYRRGGMEEPMLLFLLAGAAVSSGFLQIGMQPASLHLGQSLGGWAGYGPLDILQPGRADRKAHSQTPARHTGS